MDAIIDTAQSRLNSEATIRYLKHNGPPPDVFKPDPWVEEVIKNLPEDQKILHRTVVTMSKQVGWMIPEIVGLKAAHRTIFSKMEEGNDHFAKLDSDVEALSPCRECAAKTNEHLTKIDATLSVFTQLRERWLSREKMFRNVTLVLATLLVMPFLAGLAIEVVKHYLYWGS